MNKLLMPALVALVGACVVPNIAHAMGTADLTDYKKGGGSGPSSVPELSMSAGAGAFVVIAGAALVIAGRRKRASKHKDS